MSFPISLRHLRVFIAVAELGSVTKAAEFLYRAQSAVTRSIHQLELVFGVELFERKASGMLCTVFGSGVLFRARRAMHEFRLAADEIAARVGDQRSASKAHLLAALCNERRLVMFVKLAESHHMPTVAKSLGISQPAVSSAINDLESSLGIALFKRTSKGMVATDEGELLVFRAKRALAELRHVYADLAALRGTTEGRVLVGALPLGRTFILPRAISRVLADHPRLRFSTVEGPFDTLATSLRAGDIDFIFGALRPADYARDLAGEPLMNDKMSVVVRRGHPLTALPNITMDQLMGSKWVLSGQGTPARALFDRSFTAANLAAPVEAVETSDLAILRGLLLHGDMVTAISTQQLHYEIAAGMLTALDIEIPDSTRAIGITQRRESHASPGALALMAAIRAIVDELGGERPPQP
jgi:LysR family transcriptional regulator of gallate degradation